MRRSERSKTAPAVNAGWRRPLALGMVSSVAITTFGLPALADVNTKPAEEGESAASILSLNLMGDQLGGIGESRAFFPGGPEVDNAGLADVTLGTNEVLNIGNGVTIPVDQIIDYGELGALLSRSTATDALNGEAVTGIAGANGGITLDGEAGSFGTAKLDLLSLFKATGADTITDQILTKAEITAGVGGAHVKAVDGEFEDPDGVGGPGQYRVAEANLELKSPLVEDISSAIYDSVGALDGEIERIVNDDAGIKGIVNLLTAAIPGAEANITVDSNMQEEIFEAIVGSPITTQNEILTVDFSTGTMYVDLDKAYSGERPEGVDLPDGINNQAPNTELIDDQLYPIIGESIHDLINEVVNIAVGAVAGALGSVTVNVDVTTPNVPIVGGTTLKWSANLMGDVQPLECEGSAAACGTIEPLANGVLAPLANTVIAPLRDFILSDDGQALYELAITDIKTGLMTQPIRAVLSPFFTVLNKVVSLQLNHQREVTCEGTDGAQVKGLEVSALSLGVLGGDGANDGAGRLNLGTAGVRLGACEAAAINPAITVDPGSVAPGTPTNVTGEGFTPDGDVTLQLVDPDGNPVGEPVPVTAGPDGTFPSTPVPVPEDAAPGEYKIVATDVTTNTPVEGNVTVTDGTTPQPGNGTIGDTVFDDANKDGLQTEGEAGVPNVVVNLLDADGNPVEGPDGQPRTTTTDDSGKYSFGELPNGDYTVEFVAPDGKTFSPAGAGDDRALDSDPNAEGVTPVVTLSDDAPTTDTVDAGLVDDDGTTPQPGNGSIGDTVWEDTNKDGIQDEGEPGVAGVTVNLLDSEGSPYTDENGDPITATTDETGKYLFEKLPEGSYFVDFDAPEGKKFSPADQGDDDAKDSDAGSDGRTPAVVLTADAPTTDSVDAGLVDLEDGEINPVLSLNPTSVEPGDTTEATGEGFTPDGDVTVQLVDKDGNPVGDPITVKADPDGKIPATSVPVPEDAAPGDYKVVATDVTTDTPVSSNLTVTDGSTPQPGNGSIGDTVWEDANKDGIQDEGEAGVPGVTVNLLDADGNPVNGSDDQPRTTTTDDSGKYSFGELPEGDYSVEFEAPEGKTFSPVDAGDDDSKDSDAGSNGRTAPVSLTTAAPTNDTVDAGLVDAEGQLTPSLTLDPNSVAPGDTTEATGEGFTPEGDVTVQLVDKDGNPVGDPITVKADPEGKIPATSVPVPEDAAPGDYKVVATDVTTETPAEAPLKVTDGTTPQPGNGSIGDTVWADANKDGIQDEGEDGVPGVTVNLLDGSGAPVNDESGAPRTATTDDSGNYTFDKLPNGDYVVEFVAPEGKSFSPADAGDDDAKDSDANVENGRTPAVALTTEAPNNNTVDAGLVDDEQAAQPSITVDPSDVAPGEETTVKGKDFDPNETVTVVIKDKDGNPIGDPIEVTTDENGEFTTPITVPEGTNPGEYEVVVTDKDGDETKAPINVTDGSTGGNGELGDRVWRDLDSDGIQDAGEAGLSGVTVNLLDASGAPVNGADGKPVTATTDENGNYTFAGLELGEYTVEFVAPEGAKFSPANAGDDRTQDSNAGDNGRSEVVALTSTAPVNKSIDAGVIDAPAVEEATVTVDPSEVDPGEETQVTGDGYAPNSEVTVTLTDKDGNPVGDPIKVTTDENGHFTAPLPVGKDVTPGGYTVTAEDTEGNKDTTDLTVSDPDGENPNPNPGGEGELGDRVWRDANSDGIQDKNESGLAGAVVNLLDSEGKALTDAEGNPITTTTDENGSYSFTGLALGEYIVEFAAPEGASFSPAEAGDDRGIDSNAGENGRSQTVTLTAQAPVDRTIDAGIVNAPAVDEATVTVNPDEVAPGETTVVNGDGYAPNTEVTVTLTDKDGNPVGDPIKVTTDENGHFTTEVTVPEDAAPGEYTVTAEDSEGNKDTTDLTVTEPDDGNNGGNNGQLGDRVWRDLDKDGIQDANEPGLGNVKVNLLDEKGEKVASTTTSENGTYTFAGLKIKQYIVEFEAPKGASFAPAGVGSDNGVDSNADKDGRSELVTLTTQAPVNNSIDAGVVDAPAVDEATVTVNPEQVAPGETTTVNGEGYAPNTEVTVQLTDKDGKPVGEPVKVTTDENGNFSTQITVPEDAAPGEYTVTAEDTEGNKDDTRLLVTDGGNVGNDGATLGDYVWNDANKDGIQNKEEAGVAGVGVALLDAEGNPVLGTDGNALITTTGEDGKYGFGGLNYGEYTVQFNAPSGASFTKTAAGEDRNVDSDANKDGRTAAVSLSASASSNQSVDAGLVIDENAETPSFTVTPDEVAPGEEVTIEGEGYAPNTDITIELRDKDGNVIETIEVTTDDDGKFITKLTVPEDAKEGDYKVVTRDPKGVEQTRDLRVTDKDANTCSAEQGITVTPSKAKAGETVTVKGQGFTEGQTVAITVTGEDGKEVKVAINEAAAAQLITIDESCGFEFKIQLPKDIKEGTYDVNVNDEDGKTLESGQFEVVGSDQNNGNGDNDNNGTNNNDRDKDGLADTGANVIGYSLLGLLAAAGGVALTVAARRKARNS